MIELGKTYQDKSGNSVRIICVDRVHQTHPIVGLTFDEDTYEGYASFTKDGRFRYGSNSDYDLILPEDYSTYAIDEPVMVRDNDGDYWRESHFAGIQNGRPCAFHGGATSWTSNTKTAERWNQCRRPTKEELGEK